MPIDLIPKGIEEYCLTHSDSESELYGRLTEETYAKQDMPQMLSGPLVGNLLQLLVRLTKASRVLDIGTFTGYSALKMAEAAGDGGVVYTCENKRERIEFAGRYFREAPWGTRIKVVEGPALESMKSLISPFDVVFIDAEKVNYLNYYRRALESVRIGGIIALDNTLWSGRVMDPEDESTQLIADTNDFIQNDDRVHNVLLPIRDGVMIAYKK